MWRSLLGRPSRCGSVVGDLPAASVGVYDRENDSLRTGDPAYTTGMEHSPTSATATGWERTPGATQRAAREALRQVGER